VPLDLGASAVTGMHVSSVYLLRQALKLDPPARQSKWWSRTRCSAKSAMTWPAPWASTWSDSAARRRCSLREQELEALDPLRWHAGAGADAFNTAPEPNGDILMYPDGTGRSAQRPDAQGRYYFDTIVRQTPIDDRLNVEDNLEEFARSPMRPCSTSPRSGPALA